MKVNAAGLIGASGRLFYRGNEMLQQSAGLVYRPARVAETADLLAEMNRQLAARGIRFLVAVPPNSSTIYQDDLPYWAQRNGRATEYDLLLEDLRRAASRRSICARRSRRKRASGRDVYLINDVHWNTRGAIAGFNAVVEADGHPDWRIDAVEMRSGPGGAKGRGHRAHARRSGQGFGDDRGHSYLPLAEIRRSAGRRAPMPDHVVDHRQRRARRSW